MYEDIGRYQFLYYRGYLNYCNYTCSYCSFAKKKLSEETIQRDKAALNLFLMQVKKCKQDLSVFFVPYGEALCHSYYMEAIAGLTKQVNIKEVAIQTNASFNMDKLAVILDNMGAEKEKITLWCSFHPSQISADDFLGQCRQIKAAGINYTVGMVAGHHLSEEEMLRFRKKLCSNVYMWFNYLDGKKRSYTEDEIAFYTLIDPYFVMELNKPAANCDFCSGGKDSVFVEANGRYQACNISRRAINKQRACAAVKCACYLSYSNRLDNPLLVRYDKSGRTRLIKREPRKLLFLDIDGTILKSGKIRDGIIEQLIKLSDTYLIFVNTAVSYRHAVRKCHQIWKYLSGGIFANGADIRVFEYQYQVNLGLEGPLIQEILQQKYCYKIYSDSSKLIKISVPRSKLLIDIEKLKLKYYIGFERNLVYITNRYGGKENGISRIKHFYLSNDCDIYFIGNSENDHLSNPEIKNIII